MFYSFINLFNNKSCVHGFCDLSTPAIISDLDLFISRHDVPSKVCSDLGTNFVGAAIELKEMVKVLKQDNDQIQNYCDKREIARNFNPPSAPNCEGLW